MMKPLNIVVCVDCRGGFGKEGRIPWNIPADMKKFKDLTTGNICIMGRRTYVDILDGRQQRDNEKGITDPIDQVLRDRTSYVVTSTVDVVGATAVRGLREACDKLDPTDTRSIWIIGGRRLFIEAFSWNPTVYMTVLKGNHYDCDTKFPIDILNKSYKVTEGKEDNDAYYITYNHK